VAAELVRNQNRVLLPSAVYLLYPGPDSVSFLVRRKGEGDGILEPGDCQGQNLRGGMVDLQFCNSAWPINDLRTTSSRDPIPIVRRHVVVSEFLNSVPRYPEKFENLFLRDVSLFWLGYHSICVEFTLACRSGAP